MTDKPNLFDQFDQLPLPEASSGPPQRNIFADFEPQVQVAPTIAEQKSKEAQDIMRAGVDTATFGLGDVGMSYITGRPIAVERQATEKARKETPIGTLAADVAAGIPFARANVGGRLAGMLGAESTGIRNVGNLLPKALGFGTEGAVYSGAQAVGHGRGTEDVREAAGTGAVMGGVLGTAARVARQPIAKIPSEAELEAAKSAQYQAVQQVGRTAGAPGFDPNVLAPRLDRLEQDLLFRNLTREVAPESWKAIDRMRAGVGVPGAQITHNNFDGVRKGLNAATGEDRAAAVAVRGTIDDFTNRPPPAAIKGDPNEALMTQQELLRARGNYAALKRSEMLTKPMEAAEISAAGEHSGLNYYNKLRQNVGRIIKNEDNLGGLTPEETARLVQLNARTGDENAMRYVTNMLGGGGGLGAVVSGTALGGVASGLTGYQTGDIGSSVAAGAGGIAAGMAGRRWLNSRIAGEAESVAESFRQRSPLFRERAAATPGTTQAPAYPGMPGAVAARNAIAEELIRRRLRDRPDYGDLNAP